MFGGDSPGRDVIRGDLRPFRDLPLGEVRCVVSGPGKDPKRPMVVICVSTSDLVVFIGVHNVRTVFPNIHRAILHKGAGARAPKSSK